MPSEPDPILLNRYQTRSDHLAFITFHIQLNQNNGIWTPRRLSRLRRFLTIVDRTMKQLEQLDIRTRLSTRYLSLHASLVVIRQALLNIVAFIKVALNAFRWRAQQLMAMPQPAYAN